MSRRNAHQTRRPTGPAEIRGIAMGLGISLLMIAAMVLSAAVSAALA